MSDPRSISEQIAWHEAKLLELRRLHEGAQLAALAREPKVMIRIYADHMEIDSEDVRDPALAAEVRAFVAQRLDESGAHAPISSTPGGTDALSPSASPETPSPTGTVAPTTPSGDAPTLEAAPAMTAPAGPTAPPRGAGPRRGPARGSPGPSLLPQTPAATEAVPSPKIPTADDVW